MNHIEETINIDLTEDEIPSQEQPRTQFVNCNSFTGENTTRIVNNQKNPTTFKTNILRKQNHPVNNISDTKSSSISQTSTEISATNLIENLQRENPQIETVFIESDEDEDQGRNKVVPVSSALKSESSPVKAKNKLPFTVRTISPSKLNPNLVRNSNTIAIDDGTPNSPFRKYLVIPKELAPLLANSKGPISLNVPGIGPLLIPKPADILNTQSVPIIINRPTQDSRQAKLPLQNIVKAASYDPLTDQKYCWRYRRNGKRDLDGFLFNDRLGFYKAEQHRSKVCAQKFNEIVTKLNASIERKTEALEFMKSQNLNLKHIKLVEIDSIKKGRRHKKTENEIKNTGLQEYGSRNSCTPIPILTSETESAEESDSFEDLLVTKKVVFINENERRRGRKRKGRKKIQSFESPNRRDGLKKNERINKDDLQNIDKQYGKKAMKSKESDKDIFYKNLHKIQPCYVELNEDKLVESALKKYNDSHRKQSDGFCKIIDNLKRFQNEIQPIKPILIINEEQSRKLNFKDLYSKYNIVFPILEIKNLLTLRNNKILVTSAKAGYVKFVDHSILCEYLSGVQKK